MTVIDDRVVKKYLQGTVDSIFKILPLYEEDNKTLNVYIESLTMELKGFVATYGRVGITEYVSVISTLEGLQTTVRKDDKQPVVKREVFKCIKTINKICEMLEGV